MDSSQRYFLCFRFVLFDLFPCWCFVDLFAVFVLLCCYCYIRDLFLYVCLCVVCVCCFCFVCCFVSVVVINELFSQRMFSLRRYCCSEFGSHGGRWRLLRVGCYYWELQPLCKECREKRLLWCLLNKS